MGKMQRTKGINAERELVHLLEDLGVQAHRVPLSGAMANYKDDIILADESSIEVKRRKKMPAILNEMLVSADYGAIREDRGEWLIIMSLKEFAYVFKRYLEREQKLQEELMVRQLPGNAPKGWEADFQKEKQLEEVKMRILSKKAR